MSPSESKRDCGDAGAGAGARAFQPRDRERRASRRYGIELEFDLFYLWGAKHLVWAGAGRTANWSRNSILIHWNKPLSPGTSVELVVRWSEGVQLIVVGRVLSVDARGAVVRIVRRRFRGRPELALTTTAGDPLEPPAATPGHVRAS
ncbi:MAG: hypothetical protein LAP40_03905 [Acidobacteriia bacterium]|nr:hypothetical protein [Terriglobia bacterium]